MNVKVLKTKELTQLLEEKGMHVSDVQNGVLHISTASNDTAAYQNISVALSQILSDNRDLVLISLNMRVKPDGICEAVAIFISFLDISFILKDPGSYAYYHGISHVCPPFM